MEFAEYLQLGRKWLWLFFVAALIGAGVGFIRNSGKPSIYTASATVSIGRYINSPNPNYSEIVTGINLAQTYAQLVSMNDVLQGAIDALNLNFTPQGLQSLISTNILEGTSLLVITVRYTDPVLAADLANTVAEQLVDKSPTNLTAGQQAQIDDANTQIQALNQQIQQQRQEIESLDEQLANTSDPQESARLTDLKTTLTGQTTQAAAAIAQFQNTISTIQQRTNSLDIVERATIPTFAQGNNTTSVALLGALVGIALAGGVVLVLEYLDDRIKTTEIATKTLELPVVGAIPIYGKKQDTYADRLVTKEDAVSQPAEAYRRLQTNLMVSSQNGRKNVYIVTSAGPSEGKSVTAANLARTFANRGMAVLLIDADLHRPVQHQIFGLGNEVGLSTLLMANMDDEQKHLRDPEKQPLKGLDECIQRTDIPRLRVITSGFIPSNPALVLGSSLMKRWIDAFRSANNIDVVIIDTPPLLLFADSTIIATSTEAEALLVLDSQRVRPNAARKAKERLTEAGIDIKGVILNRIDPRDELGGYYGYNYSYSYYTASTEQKRERRGLFGLRR